MDFGSLCSCKRSLVSNDSVVYNKRSKLSTKQFWCKKESDVYTAVCCRMYQKALSGEHISELHQKRTFNKPFVQRNKVRYRHKNTELTFSCIFRRFLCVSVPFWSAVLMCVFYRCKTLPLVQTSHSFSSTVFFPAKDQRWTVNEGGTTVRTLNNEKNQTRFAFLPNLPQSHSFLIIVQPRHFFFRTPRLSRNVDHFH